MRRRRKPNGKRIWEAGLKTKAGTLRKGVRFYGGDGRVYTHDGLEPYRTFIYAYTEDGEVVRFSATARVVV